MKVRTIRITNIKSIADSGVLELSPRLNVLIGQNNAGKSVLIRSLYMMQNPNALAVHEDIRFNESVGEIEIIVRNSKEELQLLGAPQGLEEAKLQFTLDRPAGSMARFMRYAETNQNVPAFPQAEPNNVIYPFLAKRKVMVYDEVVNQSKTNQVLDNFTHLVSKVDRLTTPSHELFSEFRDSCRRIVGFEIDSVPSPNGHKVGLPIGKTNAITLETMGEGVPHLLALIADLCIAEDKVFLIEEIENDLHPRALKSLLELVIEKSDKNQFVVTTHSNIVARYLGSVPGSKTFRVQLRPGENIPTADYREVSEDPEDRREVLEELGYEMTDYDLWDGWLILEESSAERIIRDLLIPQFAPGLVGRLRTIASGGVDGVTPKFDDFNRLFLFTHLTPSYRNLAWVVVDAGGGGEVVVTDLRERYGPAGWTPEHFRILSQTDFELYYPPRFQEAAILALASTGRKERQAAKTALLGDVLEWIAANPSEAKIEFAESATEVVALLGEIEEAIDPVARRTSGGS